MWRSFGYRLQTGCEIAGKVDDGLQSIPKNVPKRQKSGVKMRLF